MPVIPQCVLAVVLAKEQPLGNTGALSVTNHRNEGVEKVIAAYRLYLKLPFSPGTGKCIILCK